MTTPLIEAIAASLEPLVNDGMAEPFKSAWLTDLAQAALTAITEAGYAVVPKTVTPQLLDALDDEAPAVGCCIMDRRTATEIYDLMVFRAMISAAQGGGA